MSIETYIRDVVIMVYTIYTTYTSHFTSLYISHFTSLSWRSGVYYWCVFKEDC